MSTVVSCTRSERVQKVIDAVRATRVWASYEQRDVEHLVGMIDRGDYVSAALSVENEVHIHFACGNPRKGDVLAALSHSIIALSGFAGGRADEDELCPRRCAGGCPECC